MTIRRPFAIALLAVLVLSVGINLVIAGFAATRFFGFRPGGEIERIVALGIRAFPAELQDAIAENTRQQRDKFRALIDDTRGARMRMFEAMRANPFDQAKLEAAYDELRTKTNEVQALGQGIVAAAVAHASPETRAKIRPPRGPFP
ncbi:hypothetical protein BH10PSE9_BH10PSE9_23790 [soil metagenome]